jgi:hypothetical protein
MSLRALLQAFDRVPCVMLEALNEARREDVKVRTVRAHKRWGVASTVLLIFTLGCQIWSQPTTPETSSAGPTGNPTICPPENIAFPELEDLENHIGWQYVHVQGAFDYPEVLSAALLSLDEDADYAVSDYGLGGNSHILTLERLLCYDGAGNPAWEIVDVVRTVPLGDDEVISLTLACTRNGQELVDQSGESSTDEFVIPIVNRTTGEVVFAWAIDRQSKNFVEASIEGLSC